MTIIDLATDDRDAYKLLTVVDAADYLALSRGAIYIGRARRIPLGELQRFVAGCIGN